MLLAWRERRVARRERILENQPVKAREWEVRKEVSGAAADDDADDGNAHADFKSKNTISW